MVGLAKHLEEIGKKHRLLKLVDMHEKDTIRRLGEEFAERRQVYQQSSNVKRGTRKMEG